MKWFFKRLSEPSSQAALSGIAAGGTLALNGNWETGIISIITGLFGFIIGEKGKK